MIDASLWTNELVRLGFCFATGVPCSSLSPLQDEILNDPGFEYIAATNEGQAVALAAGARAGGAGSIVLMQNSGLGNAINPLASLTEIFHTPVLLVISWRGQPGKNDEPQHRLMGEITTRLLDSLKIEHVLLSSDHGTAIKQLHAACRGIEENGCTYAIIVPDGTFARGSKAPEFNLPDRARSSVVDLTRNRSKLGRADVLSHIGGHPGLDSTVLIATTGKTGRELYTLCDKVMNLYMVGSMGLASSFALGLSRQIQNDVLVIDGDGAALMHMGAMATIGCYGKKSLKHLILDNGCYDSTGGQFTNSQGVDFASIALNCGYAASFRIDCLFGLDEALAAQIEGPAAIHMAIRPGSISPLARPAVTPAQVLQRLQSGLGLSKERTHARTFA